jgi:MFS superfamily sulfate permease-like transporter
MREGASRGEPSFSLVDAYQTVTSALMVVMGIVILARTLPLGVHLMALLVGLGFLGLGAHRLSFVIGYVRRRRRT